MDIYFAGPIRGSHSGVDLSAELIEVLNETRKRRSHSLNTRFQINSQYVFMILNRNFNWRVWARAAVVVSIRNGGIRRCDFYSEPPVSVSASAESVSLDWSVVGSALSAERTF